MNAHPETHDARLEQTLTAAGIGAFEWRPLRDEFRANPPLARILGIEGVLTTTPAAHLRRLIVPEDLPGLLAAADAARATGGAFRHAFRIRTLDRNEIRRVVVRGLHFCGPGGEVERVTGMIADVTDRDEHDASLRLSEERHRLVFTHNPVPLGIISSESGRYLMVNAAAAHLLGRTEEELLGVSAAEIVIPEDHHILFGSLDAGAQGLRDVGRVRMRHKDGHIVTVQGTIDSARFGDELVFLVSAMDVTAQDAAERALRESEEIFRVGFEAAATPTALLDGHGRYIRVNQAFCDLMGIDADALTGLVFLDITHEEDRARDADLLSELRAGQRHDLRVDKRYVRADGTVVWAHVSVVVLARAADGEPSLLMVEIIDQTALRETLQALRQSEERLELALDVSTDGIWDWDIPSGTLYFNANWCRMLGYAPDELSPRIETWRELAHPNDASAAYAAYDAHVAGHSDAVELELRMRRKDGSWAWVLDRGKIVEYADDGSPVRMVGTHTDITPRREAELERAQLQDQLLQAQKLEGIGVLAGGIAHDFNNLLVGILGNASLAEGDLPPDSPAAPLVSEIRSAAVRAADLTRQLLAYAGKGRFVVEPVHVTAIAEEMAALLRSVISKRAVLRAELNAELPTVEADATQLRQIVMNLITNASDALPDGAGLITLRTRLIPVDARFLRDAVGGPKLAHGTYVAIEVEDTGEGMDEATRARIFDPFFTTKFTGRGLGLAATLGIIRSHRGAIRVTSAPGVGTTVQIVLPALGASAPTASDATLRPDAWYGHGDVLLADDEPAVRGVARRALERLGFTVVESPDGQDALERVTAEPERWRLVVLDLTMPRLAGDRALLAIRKIRPDLPAVLYSGYSADELGKGLSERDRVTFLQKPFTVSTLTEAVRTALNERG